MSFPSGWARKCPVIVDHTKVVADGIFPVLLVQDNLPQEMLDADGSHACKPDGSDLRVTSDADGVSELPVEVAFIGLNDDPVLSRIEIYTRANLSSASDTTLWIWYCNPSATMPEATAPNGRNAVWSDFKFVGHLSQDPTGGAGCILDSTGNYNGTPGGTWSAEALVDGPFGKALQFSGSNHVVLGNMPVQGAAAISALVNPSNVSANRSVLSRSSSGGAATNAALSMRIDTTSKLRANLGNDSGTYQVWTTNLSLAADTWQYWALSEDGSEIIARNGANTQSTSQTVAVNTSTSDGYAIGRLGENYNGWYFVGKIAEVRLHAAARTDAWLETEKSNLMEPAAFAAAGTPINLGETGYTAFKDVELGLEVWGCHLVDLGVGLELYGRAAIDLPVGLQVAALQLRDLGLGLEVTEGLLWIDLLLGLDVTDGTAFTNLPLGLCVICAAPSLRSVVAQRLSSILSEV